MRLSITALSVCLLHTIFVHAYSVPLMRGARPGHDELPGSLQGIRQTLAILPARQTESIFPVPEAAYASCGSSCNSRSDAYSVGVLSQCSTDDDPECSCDSLHNLSSGCLNCIFKGWDLAPFEYEANCPSNVFSISNSCDSQCSSTTDQTAGNNITENCADSTSCVCSSLAIMSGTCLGCLLTSSNVTDGDYSVLCDVSLSVVSTELKATSAPSSGATSASASMTPLNPTLPTSYPPLGTTPVSSGSADTTTAPAGVVYGSSSTSSTASPTSGARPRANVNVSWSSSLIILGVVWLSCV